MDDGAVHRGRGSHGARVQEILTVALPPSACSSLPLRLTAALTPLCNTGGVRWISEPLPAMLTFSLKTGSVKVSVGFGFQLTSPSQPLLTPGERARPFTATPLPSSLSDSFCQGLLTCSKPVSP